MLPKYISKIIHAFTTPYDNANCDLDAENVQEAIDELCANQNVSASPGFSFGRFGAVVAGTWLRRPGNVPSNRAGVSIPLSNPRIRLISCSNQNIDTYTLEIWEHDGDLVGATLLTSITVTAARGGDFPVDVAASQNRQLAVRLSTTSGFVRDLGCDVVLKGGVV